MMKLKINNKTIKIKKKKKSFILSFLRFYKFQILLSLIVAVCVGMFIAIISFADRLLEILNVIINQVAMIFKFIWDCLYMITFLQEPLLFILNNYLTIILLSPPIIYMCYKFIQLVLYYRAHKYVPISHDELIENQIHTKEEYLLTIVKMFRWKPMKMVRVEIEDTCLSEFDNVIDWKTWLDLYDDMSIGAVMSLSLYGFGASSSMGFILILFNFDKHNPQLFLIFILLWGLAITIFITEYILKGNTSSDRKELENRINSSSMGDEVETF